jgi:hypothetical protein
MEREKVKERKGGSEIWRERKLKRERERGGERES